MRDRIIILKKLKDHNIVDTSCGSIHQILQGTGYPGTGVAIVPNIKETVAHCHEISDEIYFVLDGEISILLHDPVTGESQRETLGANELCVIPKGIHHKVIEFSDQNRLCVICVPALGKEDIHESTVI